ncbi:F-box domain containing protein [Pandoravirus dulcis]|uniref:F-box domain containing protein n=1 Tax=Pandoravirus dulcis TaxID=1349409 RepID=S4VP25_9VIRU|nr:F-box domain containing protein [Pandoravirus dulcis]AGO81997.1 F-box domain containing protein [Pandoravirus dulcis]
MRPSAKSHKPATQTAAPVRPRKRQRHDAHPPGAGLATNAPTTTAEADSVLAASGDKDYAGACEWMDLPDEVVFLIALQCTVGSLARLAQINRRTNAIARDDRLWRRLCRTRAGAAAACPAGPACARHRDGGDPDADLGDRIRRWLDVDARERLTERAPGGCEASPPPWTWTEFAQHDRHACCVCHVPRADGNDPTCDYRWLYASSLTPPVIYRADTDRKPRRVGRIISMSSWQWRPLTLMGESCATERAMCTYSGEVDTRDRPNGYGTLTVWTDAKPKRAGAAGSTADGVTAIVRYRATGHWSHGAADGAMRTFNYMSSASVVYFEGQCDSGRPHRRGLAVMRDWVYDGKWDVDGYPVGSGLACYGHALVRYGRHRRSPGVLMHHIVLRPDGSVACEDEYDDPYDDDPDAYCGRHDVDSEDDSDTDTDDRTSERTDADALIAEAACVRVGDHRAIRTAPVGQGYTLLRDRTGSPVYTGLLTSDRSPRPWQGTAFLAGGASVAYVDAQPARVMQRLVAVVYGRGDKITCLASSSRFGPPVDVVAFTFSERAPHPLAGRVIKGPWHVLALPSSSSSDAAAVATRGADTRRQQGEQSTSYRDTNAQDSSDSDNDDDDDEEKHKMFSIDSCGDEMIVTHLVHDPPPPVGLDAMRALADFVFWPAAAGPERDAFFDYMTANYGPRWAACRAVADAASLLA